MQFKTCEPAEAIVVEKKTIQIAFPQKIIFNQDISPILPSPEANTLVRTYEVGPSNVLAERVVVIRSDGRIEHADKNDFSTKDDVLGVAFESGTTGQLVKVVEFGLFTPASIGAIGDNFYLGSDGALVDTEPTDGYVLFVGTQTETNGFLVRICEATITVFEGEQAIVRTRPDGLISPTLIPDVAATSGRYYVPDGVIFTIEENFQSVTFGNLVVDGDLNIDGQFIMEL